MDFLNKIENEDLRAEIKTAIEQEIANAKEVAKNDTELAKDYKNQGMKEAERKILRDLKKTFGVDSTELEGVEDYKGWFDVAMAKVKGAVGQTSQEWQDKYMALKDDFTRLKEDEIPALKSQAESQIKAYKIEGALNSKLSKLENLAISVDDLKLLTDAKLRQLGVKLDLDGDVVVAKTEHGTKPTIDDKAMDFDGLINYVASSYIKKNGVSTEAKQNNYSPTIPSDKITPKKAEIINKYKAMGVEIPASLLQ